MGERFLLIPKIRIVVFRQDPQSSRLCKSAGPGQVDQCSKLQSNQTESGARKTRIAQTVQTRLPVISRGNENRQQRYGVLRSTGKYVVETTKIHYVIVSNPQFKRVQKPGEFQHVKKTGPNAQGP